MEKYLKGKKKYNTLQKSTKLVQQKEKKSYQKMVQNGKWLKLKDTFAKKKIYFFRYLSFFMEF